MLMSLNTYTRANRFSGTFLRHSITPQLRFEMRDLIKADVHGLSPDQLVGKAGHILDMMTGNASFPAPDPALVKVTDAQRTLLQAIEDAKSFSRASIAAKKVAAEALRVLLADLATYVNLVAGDDVNVALSSGFEQVKTPTPHYVEAPENLTARTGSAFASIDLRWKLVDGARMYFVYMTEGDVTDASVWKMVASTTRSRHTVGGLASSSYYSFRVTAQGARNVSVPSPVSNAKAA
jgi:uncharacterized protein YaiE (UPF0345 family)